MSRNSYKILKFCIRFAPNSGQNNSKLQSA